VTYCFKYFIPATGPPTGGPPTGGPPTGVPPCGGKSFNII